MVVESDSVNPIRNSPTVGSARCSMSLTLCFNSSKTAMLRLSRHHHRSSFDALCASIEQPHPERMLEIDDHL